MGIETSEGYIGHDEIGAETEIYDLIYADYLKNRAFFQKAFPQAKIEDASDDIHKERFLIEMNNYCERDYYKFLIKNGFAEVSLIFQLKTRDKRYQGYLESLIKEVKSS